MDRSTLKQQILSVAGKDTLPVVFTDLLQAGSESSEALDKPGFVKEDLLYPVCADSTVGPPPQLLCLTWQEFTDFIAVHIGKSAETDVFTERSLNRGLLAMQLSGSIAVDFSFDAFWAGLLLDTGKLVLKELDPEDGAVNVYAIGRDDGAVLESERTRFGIDHTLAGKWLAESWGLSSLCVQAIWLHHHSQSALQYLNVNTEFIQLLQACDIIIHNRDDSRVPQEGEALLLNLGVSAQTALSAWTTTQEMIQKIISRKDSVVVPKEAQSVEDPQKTTLEKQFKLLEAREQIIRCGVEGRSALVLRQLGRELSDSFAVSRGLYWTIDRGGCVLTGIQYYGSECTALEASALEEAGSSLAHMLGLFENTQKSHNATMLLPMKVGEEIYGYAVIILPSRAQEEIQDFINSVALALKLADTQKQLSEQEEALALGLNAQEAELRHQKMQLRLEGIQQLAAGTAHEINNPLAVISGRAQVLLQRSTEPKVVEALEAIVEQSRRANKIVVDLMQFARPDPPCKTMVQIEQVVNQILSTVKERLNQRGIQIVQDVSTALPQVHIDRKQIEQVLLHLVQNSERAMMPRGGTLKVGVRSSQDGHTMILQFSDTGMGMAPEQLDRIFEPFYTTDHSTGTGLGLAMCHSIIQRHEGSITFQSTQGAGTTCTITLPLAQNASQPTQKAEVVINKAPLTVTPTRIKDAYSPKEQISPGLILADGDKNLLEVLRGALEGRGFNVIEVADQLEIHATVLSQKVHALLCDYKIIGMEGMTLLEDIVRRKSDLPVIIFVDRDTSEEEILAMRRIGVTACLRKPFELHLLLREIGSPGSPSQFAQGA